MYLRLLPLWGIRVGMVTRKCLFPVAHFSFRERFCKVRWHPRVAVICIGSLPAIISKRSTVTSAVERLSYRKASHDVAYTTGWLGGDSLLDCWKRLFLNAKVIHIALNVLKSFWTINSKVPTRKLSQCVWTHVAGNHLLTDWNHTSCHRVKPVTRQGFELHVSWM